MRCWARSAACGEPHERFATTQRAQDQRAKWSSYQGTGPLLAFGLVSRRFTTSTALTTALESSSRPSWPSASRWRSEKSGAARETRSVAWTRLTAQTPPSACSRPSKRSTRRPTVLTPCASCAPDDEPSGCRRPAARRGAVLVGARHWEGRSLRGACHRSGHWAVRWDDHSGDQAGLRRPPCTPMAARPEAPGR